MEGERARRAVAGSWIAQGRNREGGIVRTSFILKAFNRRAGRGHIGGEKKGKGRPKSQMMRSAIPRAMQSKLVKSSGRGESGRRGGRRMER